MGDPARELGEAILRALGSAPSNADASPRPWVSLSAEAQARGDSTRQFRAWCVKRGVPIREGSHREVWVRAADVDRAIEGLPVAKVTAPVNDEVDASIQAAQDRCGKR